MPLKTPANANDWLSYPIWVDWVEPEWVDARLEASDYASRPFNSRVTAERFATENLSAAAAIIFYERTNDPDNRSLYIYAQINAGDHFAGYNKLGDIRSGFGYRWTDGVTKETPENYTPYCEA